MKVKVWYDVNTGSGSEGLVETYEIVECSNIMFDSNVIKCTVTKPTNFNPDNQVIKKLFKKFNRFEVLSF